MVRFGRTYGDVSPHLITSIVASENIQVTNDGPQRHLSRGENSEEAGCRLRWVPANVSRTTAMVLHPLWM